MHAISGTRTSTAPTQPAATQLAAQTQSTNDTSSAEDVKSKFQDFAAGTFYKEMLKSMQKMHGKAAYMNGGQAEKMFQSQMDQHVAENLAHSNTGAVTNGLYEAFARMGRK